MTLHFAKQPTSFYQALIGSLALHLSILIVFVVRWIFLPDAAPSSGSPMRVELVGLPDKTIKTAAQPPVVKTIPKSIEPPAMMPAPVVSQPTTATPKSPAPTNLAAKQRQVLQQLAALSELKNSPATTEAAATHHAEQSATTEPLKGSYIVDSGVLSGLEALDYEAYYEVLKSQLQSHWSLPQWLAEQNLKAQMAIRIDATGNVIEKVWISQSGNTVFDSAVLETILQASPLPPPPERLKAALELRGFIIRFPD